MIRRSDNETASRIDAMLGRGPLEELADDAEMRSFVWNDNPWGQSKTTARDQAFFMRTLQQYVPDRHWDYARSLLASITPLAALGHRPGARSTAGTSTSRAAGARAPAGSTTRSSCSRRTGAASASRS